MTEPTTPEPVRESLTYLLDISVCLLDLYSFHDCGWPRWVVSRISNPFPTC